MKHVPYDDVSEVHAYAVGDGRLSFVVKYSEDGPGWKRTEARAVLPTFEQCCAACPYGWVVYVENGQHRARQAHKG